MKDLYIRWSSADSQAKKRWSSAIEPQNRALQQGLQIWYDYQKYKAHSCEVFGSADFGH